MDPLNHLSNYSIILGSGSPRRHELLSGLGLSFEIISSNIPEIIPSNIQNEDAPEYLARLKADHLAPSLEGNFLLITADTVVIKDNQILGKPQSKDEAYMMITALSGDAHDVITGVCITDKNKQQSFSDKTEVIFDPFSEDEVKWFVDRFPVMDKAGAYGIQEGLGLAKIAGLNGSYYNVMGLPTHSLFAALKSWRP